MKFKRFLSIIIAALMIIAAVPVLTLAESAVERAEETRKLALLDDAWVSIDAAEKTALAKKASPEETTLAAYKAAEVEPLIDEGSLIWEADDQFAFTVEGMHCLYYYRARNEQYVAKTENTVYEELRDVNGPTSLNVLLVGPYYGQDSSFTDQYKTEAQSIAQATGGSYKLLSGTAATGPAIAENYINRGVVIYDSHGTQSGTSSYLCLTTASGITTTDYNNGWAVSSGSAAYIDGRYIQNHVSGTLSNCLVWMAICEGMKKSGKGTTGTALLAAGAAAVYGYSQSVSFKGDYEYEETFWNEMKDGATVAEALTVMKSTHGVSDPYTTPSAWPILMSPTDPFPSNPDSEQTVTCDWMLMPPVDIESYSLNTNSVELYEYETANIVFNRNPVNATNYKLNWSIDDPSVASISGSKSGVTINGLKGGETVLRCEVVIDDEVKDTLTANVKVNALPTLNELCNVPGGNLDFTSEGDYPWHATKVGNDWIAASGNKGVDESTSSMKLTLNMKANEKLVFKYKVSSEANYDWFYFFANGSQKVKKAGNVSWTTYTFTATADKEYTFEWRFTKDVYAESGDDMAYVKEVEYQSLGLMGDINQNGELDMDDALAVMRYVMHVETLTAYQIQLADINGDGSVTMNDALMILRIVQGLIN